MKKESRSRRNQRIFALSKRLNNSLENPGVRDLFVRRGGVEVVIFYYAGRALQALMLLALIAVLFRTGSDPGLAGQMTGRILFNLCLTEFLIRASQPKKSYSGQSEPPSGCNILAGGCLSFLILGGIAGIVIAVKALSGPPRAALVAHSGPNKVYTLKVPKGAKFKSEHRSDRIPQGTVKVNGESWELASEGGAIGVADIPVIRAAYTSTYTLNNGYSTGVGHSSGLGAAVSNDQILTAVSEAQVEAMGGGMGASHVVNRLGYKGKEVEFASSAKKIRGRILYLWGGQRLFYCMYGSSEATWDEARATSVLSSFHFSLR